MLYIIETPLDRVSIRLTNGNLAIQQEIEAFVKMMEEKYGTTPKPKKS